MILKGSQRSGSGQLAAHLMNTLDNDHVTLHELRGFISTDLEGALAEMHAISRATQCKQFMFSLSLNPPKDGNCGLEAMIEAADRAEVALGLENQPRAIVVHEKEGRRHIHAVWSRIDIAEMKAVPLPFYKNRLASLSKELYLKHGWELPEGHRENGWKNPLNFTLAEWQQAKRLGLDPREIKMVFSNAWRHSDGLNGFRAALEGSGYYLAAGDRRGFVAVDLQGEVFSVSRMTGVKTKELLAKLGAPDALPDVAKATQENAWRMGEHTRRLLRNARETHRNALRPILRERARILEIQKDERVRLHQHQNERQTRERKERQERFRKGIVAVWDILTGRATVIRRENEREAYAAYLRDRSQSEALVLAQMDERSDLQVRLDAARRTQRRESMATARHIASLISERKENLEATSPEHRVQLTRPRRLRH